MNGEEKISAMPGSGRQRPLHTVQRQESAALRALTHNRKIAGLPQKPGDFIFL